MTLIKQNFNYVVDGRTFYGTRDVDFVLAEATSLSDLSENEMVSGFTRLRASIGYLDNEEIQAGRKRDEKAAKLQEKLDKANDNLLNAIDRVLRWSSDKESILELVKNYLNEKLPEN